METAVCRVRSPTIAVTGQVKKDDAPASGAGKLPIIQSLWVGDALSRIEQLCVASFLENGHEFHLYVYSEVDGLPPGAISIDANSIIPEKDIFTYYKGSYAGFADWFRWELICRKGNYWVDTDIICLKPFEFEQSMVYGREAAGRIGAAVLRFPAGHFLSQQLAAACREPYSRLPWDSLEERLKKPIKRLLGRKRSDISWGSAGGPEGFTRALQHHRLSHHALPKDCFYAVPHLSWKNFYDGSIQMDSPLLSNSFGIHLWNEMARRDKDFNKNGSFEKNSVFEQLWDKYSASLQGA